MRHLLHQSLTHVTARKPFRLLYLFYCLFCFLYAGSVGGQYADLALKELPPVWLNALPEGWKRVGVAEAAPFSKALPPRPGEGMVYGKPSQTLTLLSDVREFRLVMDVMLSSGANTLLSFGSVNIRISDSWGSWGGDSSDFGAVEGILPALPAQNACKAPGTWQRVDAVFAMDAAGNIRIERLLLNGVLIHENLTVQTGPTLYVSNVTIGIQKGEIALRPVGYQPLTNREAIRLTDVQYTFYSSKKKVTSPTAIASLPILKKDTLVRFAHDEVLAKSGWKAVVYTAELAVDQTDDYVIALRTGGYTRIEMDGKPILPDMYPDVSKEYTAPLRLTAGKHTLRLFFGRFWLRPGLGIFIAGSDTRYRPLNTPASLPQYYPVELYTVRPADRPLLLRSFIQLPSEREKRPHSLSVGTPAGLHYSVDPDQNALLQVWRGPFADVTDMWYERGHPQLLHPMGVAVSVAGQPSVAILKNSDSARPDSLTEKEITYTGLSLDAKGHPAIEYQFQSLTVTDRPLPDAEEKFLNRTLTLNGTDPGGLYCRLAVDSVIHEVPKGLYSVGDGRYFIQLPPKVRTVLRILAGRRELLLPVRLNNGSATVKYSVIW